MRRFLDGLGRWNSLLWLGAGLLLTFGVGPAIFSPPVVAEVGRRHAGVVAQAVLHRYFTAQWVAALIACMAAFLGAVEGWRWPRLARPLAALLLAVATVTLFWVEPRMLQLNARRYNEAIPLSEREDAAAEFRRSHGMSQAANLLLLLGVALHAAQQRRRGAGGEEDGPESGRAAIQPAPPGS